MNLYKADIVQSLAGRDKDDYFVVMDIADNKVFLADGKTRTAEHPKRKNCKHVRKAARIDSLVVSKIHSGDKVLNSELRRMLAEFRQSQSL